MSLMPDAATPLYERVKNHILSNIGSGAWSGDRRIPSENELVAELGISRMTVNRALRELTAAGETLAIYMGVAEAATLRDSLYADGWSPATPFAIVENGAHPEIPTSAAMRPIGG